RIQCHPDGQKQRVRKAWPTLGREVPPRQLTRNGFKFHEWAPQFSANAEVAEERRAEEVEEEGLRWVAGAEAERTSTECQWRSAKGLRAWDLSGRASPRQVPRYWDQGSRGEC